MPKGTPENLVQNRDYSPEQLREWARKGGLASGESRRRRKTSMETMREVLSCKLDDDELVQKLKALGLELRGRDCLDAGPKGLDGGHGSLQVLP